MSTTPAPTTNQDDNNLARQRMNTITPHLICADAAAAIEFYKKAFGATEAMRLPGPEGKLLHAAIHIGTSMVMLCDEFPDWGNASPKTLKGTPVTIHIQSDNADALAARAVEAGATIIVPVEEAFWGDRYGVLEDPFGHRWSVATRVRDVSPDELQKGAEKACS